MIDQFQHFIFRVGLEKDLFSKRLFFTYQALGCSISDDINTTIQNNNYLSFSEFICGLAACDPQTAHGDASGEARCRYIFRYYDRVRFYFTTPYT